ncbi:hypothetical protein [Actinocorallia libanotica]|uniref:Uncharacterized protein n=1 Tax=Actinocorallia libanotica TaxID=46162 RepID=A0ABN1R2F4_9ACTN
MPMVAARMRAVAIHAMCSRPSNSPTIVGGAAVKMVWFSAPSSMVGIGAAKIGPKLRGLLGWSLVSGPPGRG